MRIDEQKKGFKYIYNFVLGHIQSRPGLHEASWTPLALEQSSDFYSYFDCKLLSKEVRISSGLGLSFQFLSALMSFQVDQAQGQ